MLAVGLPTAVMVEGVMVAPVTDELLQHKRTLLVIDVNGSVGGLNDVV